MAGIVRPADAVLSLMYAQLIGDVLRLLAGLSSLHLVEKIRNEWPKAILVEQEGIVTVNAG